MTSFVVGRFITRDLRSASVQVPSAFFFRSLLYPDGVTSVPSAFLVKRTAAPVAS
ncbi:hypothetical protein [Streptomyces sp. NPDC012825]|uniref:hypothetical protein n=1 Tax=Streptomyces sp. NPDC012825 TaxID=3364851 RepID=UPI00368E0077